MPAGRRSTTGCAGRFSSTDGGPRRKPRAKRGGRILEIGVGTGLSFDDYDASTEITGIDMSEPMIARARERLASGRYPFVKELTVMDAHALAYPDASFDCVVGQFVITLVEDPERVLSECARVLKPGGQIILVNHLYSEKRLGRGGRAPAGQEGAAARLAARVPVPAAGRLGREPWRRRADRAAQSERLLHAGALPPRHAGNRGGIKVVRVNKGLIRLSQS